MLRGAAVSKVAHLAKAESEVLRGAGIELGGLAEDVLLQSFLIDPGRRSHDLDVLALDVLGRTLPAREAMLGKGKAAQARETIEPATVLAQLAEELALILDLRERFAPGLEAVGATSLYTSIELPLVRVLVDMEWTGITIDAGVFKGLARDLFNDLERLRREIAVAAGAEINLNSPKQLAVVLFEKLQLPVLKKTKTGPSTDAEVLEQLAAMGHEVPRLILEQRELEKLRSTYVEVLPARVNPSTGRIHTTFVQAGAATGRIASTDPNLQNIPVRTPRGEAIRRGFVPTAGVALHRGGLFPDRAPPAGAFLGRPGFRRGVPARRRYPPPDRGDHLRHPGGAGDVRHAGPGEDHQLRHDLWPGPLRALTPARHQPG